MNPGGLQASSRRGAVLALMALFIALELPTLAGFERYHGDERFYTDAAIGMVQSGDWLTPRYPDGRLRFEKPLLGYLAIAGSYALLGIDLCASRLPFLIAGALLIGATWWAGIRLLRDADAALLGAAIVAASPDAVALAARSTPDALVWLLLFVGLTGFAMLLRGDERTGLAAGLAWLGTGLATATKGGLGPVLAGYAVACAALSRDRWERLRRLVHPVWLPVGVLLGISGFGIYAALHGTGVLERSVSDQVGGRVAGAGEFLRTLAAYAVIPVEHLAPWVGLAVIGAACDRGSLSVVQRSAGGLVRYAIGWLVVLLFIFAAADVVRGRYLTPAYPMLALVLASLLVTLCRRGAADAVLRRVCRVLLWIAAIVGLLLAAGGARIGAGVVVAGLVCAAVAGASLAIGRRGGAFPALLGLAVTLLVVQTACAQALRSQLAPVPVDVLARRLLEPDLVGARVAQVGRSAHLASKLRIATAGRVRIEGFARGGAEPDWGAYDVIVSDAPLPESVAVLGFRSEACGMAGRETWTAREVLDMLRADDPAAALASRSQPYWVAVRAR